MFLSLWGTCKEFLTSKKFIAAVAGIVITLAAKKGLALPEETVTKMIAIVIAYILGQGWADHGKAAVKTQAIADLVKGQTGIDTPEKIELIQRS